MAAELTVGETPRDFAKYVLRRAALAVERIELRLLGPAYRSPHLITDELIESPRFIEGMAEIPGASMAGRDHAQRTRRVEQVLRRSDSQPGPGHLQSRIRSSDRLRLCRSR